LLCIYIYITNILIAFHVSFVKNVTAIDLTCWWGNLSVKNRDKVNGLYTISCKIAGLCTPDASLEQLCMSRMANGKENLMWLLTCLTQPVRPSPLWHEIHNANCNKPACPGIVQSFINQVFEPSLINRWPIIAVPTAAILYYHCYWSYNIDILF